MGFKRRQITRRDDNDAPLAKLAKELGAMLIREPPLDYWVWWRGAWTPVEIKRPDKEGYADEFTEAQIKFRIRCKERMARWWEWRTDEDVYKSLGARISA